MKKRIFTIFLALILAVTFVPAQTQAAITPHFVIINETLLPFNESTMPIIVGSDIFIPVSVFRDLGVWQVGSDDEDRLRVYRGNRYVDFFTRPGETATINQDGIAMRWPPARRVGSRFYVPLRQVSDFFGLSFETLPIPSDIIPERQMYAVRIISTSVINGPSAVGMNRAAIRSAYLERFAPPPPPPVPPEIPPGEAPPADPPPVIEELPPDYSDVTVHLSFRDVSAGGAYWILDLLDLQTEQGFNACFFINAEDIFIDPGLIRRISGTGHTIGIWLNEGTFEEYTRISALLFEAAKVRTVIISADEAAHTAMETAYTHGLIFWESTETQVDYLEMSVEAITAIIPRESGARKNLMFTCSEEAAQVLPGVYSFLRTNLFTVERITETVIPISNNTH